MEGALNIENPSSGVLKFAEINNLMFMRLPKKFLIRKNMISNKTFWTASFLNLT